MKRGVSVLVLNKKGEVLATQRQDLHTWVFPGGGSDEGETLEQTARREVEEETGVKIKIDRLAAIYLTDHFFWKGVNFFFLAKAIGGKLKRQKGETLNLRWVKKEELVKILTEKHYQRFQDAFSDNKEIKLRISRQFPISLAKMPVFFWRRYLGKWLGLARV